MHARGVHYAAYLDLPGGSQSTAPFYETTDWQHPPIQIETITAPSGSFIRFECDYHNASSSTFVQGLSADQNEMCMFSAFYYPEADADQDSCVSGDEHGVGDRNCAQTTSCIDLCSPADAPQFSDGRADVGACFQQCVVEACPNVTGALFPQLLCTQEKCAQDCVTHGAACSSCVELNCKSELDACQALSCSP
jgi:hypothetical protein